MGEFKQGSHLAQGDVESVEVEAVGRCRGGRALQTQKKGGKSDSVSNRQSYLPCKSAFINATFVSKIIGKEKAKYTSC